MKNSSPMTLGQLGWKNSFQQQLTLEELEQNRMARVIEQHRTHYLLITEQGTIKLQMHHKLPTMCVGDWVVMTQDGLFTRCLERFSLIQRKAAGSKIGEQLIAANIDTLFIVCALNEDFNLSRIERFVTLAREAGAEPVVVLSKADLCDDPSAFVMQVQKLDPLLGVVAINGLDHASLRELTFWCGSGKTIGLTGSSGVGKSTLLNLMSQKNVQLTQGIREDDGKGRHTTTSRSMHWIENGTIIIDTPGMREIQLFDCSEGLEETFQDVVDIMGSCRFSDCQHETEPGCEVKRAIAEGRLSERRLNNYLKLDQEQSRNSLSIAQKREKNRQFSKMCRTTQSAHRLQKKGY